MPSRLALVTWFYKWVANIAYSLNLMGVCEWAAEHYRAITGRAWFEEEKR